MTFVLLHVEFDRVVQWVSIAQIANNRALLGVLVMRFDSPKKIIICLQVLYHAIEWDSREGWLLE